MPLEEETTISRPERKPKSWVRLLGWSRRNSTLIIKKTVVFFAVATVFLFIFNARAQTPTLETGLSFAQATGLADADIRVIIAKIIRVFLGLLGIIAVGFTIYGGFMYMTAGGSEEKIATAKNILKNMAIGLAIILSAYGIVQFVITSLYNSYYAQVTEGGAALGEAGAAAYFGSGALGSIIESHYPKRNAPWPGEPPIPRNTSIVITFKLKMLAATLATTGQVNAANIKIFATAAGEANALTDVAATLSADGKTLLLQPKALLGDPVRDTNYTVRLTSGLKIDDGTPAFGNLGGEYKWSFTVSTKVDRDPPYVVSVVPVAVAGRAEAPNIITQINFSEPVNPLTASGLVRNNFRNLIVESAPGNFVDGEFKISNNYQTVEFVPSTPCGQNSCGATIYCLPTSASIKVTAESPSLARDNPEQPFKAAPAGSSFIYNGVVDMAGNALDGNKDNAPQGPPADNYSWQFTTAVQPDTTAPKIDSITPGLKEENVRLEEPVTATFDKPMSISSFSNILFKTSHGPIWYFKTAENLQSSGNPVTSPTQLTVKTKVIINHAPLLAATPPAAAPNYFPFIPQTVTDVYQNCFYPAVGPPISPTKPTDCVLGRTTDPSCFNGLKNPSVSTCEDNQICPFGAGAIKNTSP